MLNEHLTRKQTVGIGIAAIGTLAVILGGNPNLNGNAQFLYGSLILLATPVLWAAYNLVGKKTLEKYDPFLVAGYVTVIGGLALIPFVFADNALSQITSMSASSWVAILFLAVACSLFGYFIWFYVLKQIGATVTSSFLFIEPLVTVVLAATLVGEQLSIYTATGGVLIFIGVRLITRNKLV
jgi:drug/metabolite transporter (DMT)-like permease